MNDGNDFGGDTFGGGGDFGGGQFGSAGGGNSIEGVGGRGDGSGASIDASSLGISSGPNFGLDAGIGLNVGFGIAAYTGNPLLAVSGAVLAIALADPAVRASVYQSFGTLQATNPQALVIMETTAAQYAVALGDPDFGSQQQPWFGAGSS